MHNPHPLRNLIGKIVMYTGDRGLTVIGRVAYLGVDDDLGSPVVTFAPGSYVVRRWGTDAGIGQLIAGPRAETILDINPGAPVILPLIATVSLFAVDQKAWAEKFPAVAAEETWNND